MLLSTVRRAGVALFGPLALCAATVGCSDPGDELRAHSGEPVPLTRLDAAGGDVSPYDASYGTATGDGDDLVVIEPFTTGCTGEDRTAAALRRSDGSWWRLPPVPFGGYVQLATADGRAVAGGVACTRASDGTGNDVGELAFAILRPDRSGWVRVDAPGGDLQVSETEMTTSPGPGPLAEFAIGPTTHRVNAQGRLVEWSPPSLDGPSGSSDVGCSVGDTYVSVNVVRPEWDQSGSLPEPAPTGEVHLSVVGGSDPPEPVGTPPAGSGGWPVLCAGGRASFGMDGTGATLDVERREWSTAPTNLREVTAGFVSPITGRLATAADGPVAFLQGADGSIVRQVDGGLWQATGATGHVYATGAQVLTIGRDRAVTVVWPQAQD